jgi:Fe-S cluster assembly scaffold protein SufB
MEQPNWITLYKETENKIKDNLPVEEKEIFAKYNENESAFLPKTEFNSYTSGRIILENANSDGIDIKPLLEINNKPSEFDRFLDKDRIQAFINSRLNDGLVIKIRDNIDIKTPLKIKYNATDNTASKIFITVGRNSRIKIVFEVSGAHNVYSGLNIDVISEEDSSSDLTIIDCSKGVGITNYNLITKGNINVMDLAINESFTRKRLWINLFEHSEVNIKQAVIGNDNSYFDIESEINHIEKNTKSNVMYKSALGGKAKSVYKGVIRQGDNAYNSYTYLSESSLLLSKDAKNISVPSLEIENNELKAYHSASSEPVNKNALFYLMSRGLEKEEATKVITIGFMSQFLNENDTGYEPIKEAIYKKLDLMTY